MPEYDVEKLESDIRSVRDRVDMLTHTVDTLKTLVETLSQTVVADMKKQDERIFMRTKNIQDKVEQVAEIAEDLKNQKGLVQRLANAHRMKSRNE